MLDYENLKNDSDWISPIQIAIKQFKSATNLSKLVGIRGEYISRWKNNGGGRIPVAYVYKILQVAEKYRIRLTPRQLICGGYKTKLDKRLEK